MALEHKPLHEYVPIDEYELDYEVDEPDFNPSRTLWVGNLEVNRDYRYLLGCFMLTRKVVKAKVHYDKKTGKSKKFGFIEFETHRDAKKALKKYRGTLMPDSTRYFKMSWMHADKGSETS